MSFSYPILLVGSTQAAEFRELAVWLVEHGAVMAENFPAALGLLNDDNFSPVFIVLAEFAPPALSQDQIHALRQLAPLAKIIRLLGPWFEGETRTGQPPPNVQRIYWHQWAARLPHFLDQTYESGDSSQQSTLPAWLLPNTASDDDRLLAVTYRDSEIGLATAPAVPLIAVVARDRETGQSLCDVCTLRGWKTVWLRKAPLETPLKVDALLFDSRAGAAAELATAELATVAQLKTISNGAPLVVLQGFPRPEDVARWQAAGAAAVVSKPFLADDLLQRLSQCLPQTAAIA